MKFRKQVEKDIEPEDTLAWLFNNGVADFLLLHTHEIKYMAMLGYTFLHGAKLFPTFTPDSSTSYKFVSMILQCTGGGILVPIFINSIPVPLAQDAYPIAITISFLLHLYLPVLRDIMLMSPIVKTGTIILYETMRASVVVKLTGAAGKSIPPSDFEFALFGPIFCGTIAGCGGAFLPLNKGLGPIQTAGLGQPMLSALVGATFYHLFLHTSMSNGVVDASKKAQVLIAAYFIAYNLYTSYPAMMGHHPPTAAKEKSKKER